MTNPTTLTRTTKTPAELLADPNLVTVSVSQAARILGVARSTAHAHYKRTGELAPNVPVIRVGRRCVVSLAHLRAALGLAELVSN
jgi:hypothetical protein